jgi:AraC-like DNA-binding protein
MTAGVSVVEVTCRWHAGARMHEQFQTFGLSLVRRGLFVRHTRRVDQLVDSTAAYFEQPGLEQLVSHPVAVRGYTTVVVLSDEAMVRYAGDLFMPDGPIPVSPDVHRDHAELLSDVRSGIDDAELDARLTWMIGCLVETASPGRLTARRPATARSHKRIVDHVREAIAANPASLDLQLYASDLGHTPFHISRVFRRAMGTTLTQHRNGVRVAAAIDQIGQGDRLADVAVDLGFADQSHLARVLQRAVNIPPGRLRRRLSGDHPQRVPGTDIHVQDAAPC